MSVGYIVTYFNTRTDSNVLMIILYISLLESIWLEKSGFYDEQKLKILFVRCPLAIVYNSPAHVLT